MSTRRKHDDAQWLYESHRGKIGQIWADAEQCNYQCYDRHEKTACPFVAISKADDWHSCTLSEPDQCPYVIDVLEEYSKLNDY